MNTRPIRFFHRGQITDLASVPATRSVLDWLREDQRRTGTKEGCAEGDCGACTVVVAELDAAGGLQLKPINSCIQFVPTLDGKALFTVEDISRMGTSGALHPVQASLVAHHGSQCGFCTPGFVMSLWATYETHGQADTTPTRQQLADDLSGNLCRCTGYRPILDAGQQMFQSPPALLHRQAVVDALKTLAADPPLHTAEGFHAPHTLSDFALLRQQKPQAQLLAGSTDIGLWVTKQFRVFPELLYLGRVAELQNITRTPQALHIGAAVSLHGAWQALAQHWPELMEVGLRFASPPVRHTGTMGGNVANGSPIGDSAPVLIALRAQIELQRGEAVRSMPLEDFYTGYMQNQLQAGEFVRGLVVPLGSPAVVRAYKVSKRFDCDISALCAGLALVIDTETPTDTDTDRGVVRSARLAFGGMAATVQRARGAEAALVGQPWNEASLRAAQAALAQDFTPLSDMRASAAYRLQVAQNLLRRLWLETRTDDPMPAGATSVWAHGAVA